MNKIVFPVLFMLLLLPLFAEDSDYLKNVRLEPEHGSLNYDGQIKVLFDLPKDDLVEKAYLSVVIGVEEIALPFSKVEGSKVGYLNNALTIKGNELYAILESKRVSTFFRTIETVSDAADDDAADDDAADDFEKSDTEELDNETSDEDVVEDRAWADKTYEIKLTVEIDSSGNEKSDDNEKDDSDTASSGSTGTVIPEKVFETIKINFDNFSPKAPEKAESEGGDKRIILRVFPPADPDDSEKKDKIGRYHVKLSGLFDRDGKEIKSVLEYSSNVDDSSYNKNWEFSISGKEGVELINNDDNKEKYRYKVEIWAEDIAGNSDSGTAITISADAVTTYGFWDNYKNKGGKDDGGFCFVATAGYGSYFHPNVMILRDFRDKILSKFKYGRHFIKVYYDFGRIPAKIITDHSFLKPVSRTLLIPFVISSWFLTTISGNFVIALWLVSFLIFIFRKKLTRSAIIPVIFLGIISFSGSLYGVDGEFSFNNSFYYPSKIDDEMAGKPFKEIGGSGLRYLPALAFGFKIPVLEDYIRWSFIGGVGYTKFKGTAIKADGEKSSDKSDMHFIPVMGEMKLRPVYWFPVWPYATIGLDYYIWWVRENGDTAEDGGTFGFHGSFGLMISLNWLDESSSRKFEESTGITNTALFVHYRLEKINDFEKKESFDLSGSRFEFGITFEF